LLSVDRNYIVDSKPICVQEIVFIADSITGGIEVWNRLGQEIWRDMQPWPAQRQVSSSSILNKVASTLPRYSFAEFQFPSEIDMGPSTVYLPMPSGPLTDRQIDGFLIPQRPQEGISVTSRGFVKVDDHYAPVSQ
jgi:hypothetical protein